MGIFFTGAATQPHTPTSWDRGKRDGIDCGMMDNPFRTCPPIRLLPGIGIGIGFWHWLWHRHWRDLFSKTRVGGDKESLTGKPQETGAERPIAGFDSIPGFL